MITIKYGNLLESDCDIICHQVNCQGVMGSGIAKAIKDKWPEVYTIYKAYCNKAKCSSDLLGKIIGLNIKDSNQIIINFCSQDNYLPRTVCHTDYMAFKMCCQKLKFYLYTHDLQNKVIGFPYRIGCGLGGGDWGTVLDIITEEFKDYEVEIWKI